MALEKGNQFKTLFFDWYWRGFLWSAKDPIANNVRWIIRPSSGFMPAHTWELITVIDQNPYKQETGNNVDRLAWAAVSLSITRCADYVYKYAHALNPKKVEAARQFLEGLNSFGDITNGNAAQGSSSSADHSEGQDGQQ